MPLHYGSEWVMAEAPSDNLTRLMSALAKGLHLPVTMEGHGDAIGFVVRIDDAPFGPLAVIHLPYRNGVRVCYRDPDELHVLMADGQVRILDSIVL